MKVVRSFGLAMVLLGFATLFWSMHRATHAGSVVGVFPLATQNVETVGDLLGMIRRANGLLIGNETHPQLVSTTQFAIPASEERTVLWLSIRQAVGHVKNLQSPDFSLIDDTGKVVLRNEVNGLLGAGSSNKVGLKTTARFYIGEFRPESERRYVLAAKLDQRVFSAFSNALEIEARQGEDPTAERNIGVGLLLLFLGIIIGVTTKPKNEVKVA